jgi:hypothetical protein
MHFVNIQLEYTTKIRDNSFLVDFGKGLSRHRVLHSLL